MQVLELARTKKLGFSVWCIAVHWVGLGWGLASRRISRGSLSVGTPRVGGQVEDARGRRRRRFAHEELLVAGAGAVLVGLPRLAGRGHETRRAVRPSMSSQCQLDAIDRQCHGAISITC